MFIFVEDLAMRKNVLLALLEDGEKVSLYSPRFEEEQYTEFEKFLLRTRMPFQRMSGNWSIDWISSSGTGLRIVILDTRGRERIG